MLSLRLETPEPLSHLLQCEDQCAFKVVLFSAGTLALADRTTINRRFYSKVCRFSVESL